MVSGHGFWVLNHTWWTRIFTHDFMLNRTLTLTGQSRATDNISVESGVRHGSTDVSSLMRGLRGSKEGE